MDDEYAEAVAECWRNGDLTYLLHDGQLKVYDLCRAQQDSIRAGDPEAGRKFALNISRRWGKSWCLLTMACEDGLLIDRALIRYAAATDEQVTEIVTQIMPELLEGAPDDLKPVWRASTGTYTFPSTGAVLKLSGMHTRQACDAQRGTRAHRCYVDEAAFSPHMEYLIKSVLMPQCLTTNGSIIISSTPPESPAHPFAALCAELEATGRYHKRTIYDADAPHITPALIEEFKKECGGEHTTEWKREYLCEFVVDDQTAIVPEFTEAERTIVDTEFFAEPPPRYRDLYVIADIGFVDLSFWLFGYYHFEKALWVVEDEYVAKNKSVTEMVRAAKAKEHELWWSLLPPQEPPQVLTGQVVEEEPANDNAEPYRPYACFADVDQLVLAEMSKEQRYRIAAVRNDDLDAAVNALRLATHHRKYRIHPRCTNLIAHLRSGIWNTSRTGFARMGSFGHFDGVAAAMYFERHVNKHHNPAPAVPEGVSPATHMLPPGLLRQRAANSVAKAFGSRWKR